MTLCKFQGFRWRVVWRVVQEITGDDRGERPMRGSIHGRTACKATQSLIFLGLRPRSTQPGSPNRSTAKVWGGDDVSNPILRGNCVARKGLNGGSWRRRGVPLRSTPSLCSVALRAQSVDKIHFFAIMHSGAAP